MAEQQARMQQYIRQEVEKVVSQISEKLFLHQSPEVKDSQASHIFRRSFRDCMGIAQRIRPASPTPVPDIYWVREASSTREAQANDARGTSLTQNSLWNYFLPRLASL